MANTHVTEAIQCQRGDITRQHDMDAVVNAANAELRPGGGVAGAIHRAAGPALDDACRAYAPIAPGQAVMTQAFELPNRYVIHCLGPVYGRDTPSDVLLADCHRNAIALAQQAGLASVAFPALSTGAFGYPVEEAAEVAVRSVLDALSEPGTLEVVRFVLFGQEDLSAFESALQTHTR